MSSEGVKLLLARLFGSGSASRACLFVPALGIVAVELTCPRQLIEVSRETIRGTASSRLYDFAIHRSGNNMRTVFELFPQNRWSYRRSRYRLRRSSAEIWRKFAGALINDRKSRLGYFCFLMSVRSRKFKRKSVHDFSTGRSRGNYVR